MIAHLDHLVLTVEDIYRTVDFYTTVLDMREVSFGEGRTALSCGQQKINLHKKGQEFEPKALFPTPGSADLCFIASVSLDAVIARLYERGIPILEGPVRRTGAKGAILSIYFRDPDSNLIEVSNYIERL
ncbi:VOC family protein [Nostoc sp. FACHB-87]|uniref:VOC family protein n=1 Tax=Nostocaceae TaxID=1162 RepID=UPI00168358A9|nr:MULTISPECIES: VOC family protein [Nostocaceae]MBD2300017.1 VOC family protein [Nostoc sp. FACHB-190]MBD2455494.1 VOC family protein [Nostoc sp. FACHB-87]MBD2478614.1 VOC family protein [Anabaena sp. FACHB-83]